MHRAYIIQMQKCQLIVYIQYTVYKNPKGWGHFARNDATCLSHPVLCGQRQEGTYTFECVLKMCVCVCVFVHCGVCLDRCFIHVCRASVVSSAESGAAAGRPAQLTASPLGAPASSMPRSASASSIRARELGFLASFVRLRLLQPS